MNKATYEQFKQENLGERMAKAVERERRVIGFKDTERLTPVPNRAAKRRVRRSFKRFKIPKEDAA